MECLIWPLPVINHTYLDVCIQINQEIDIVQYHNLKRYMAFSRKNPSRSNY